MEHCYSQITSILGQTEYVQQPIVKQTAKFVTFLYLAPFPRVQSVIFPIICDAIYHPIQIHARFATANS
jgi:hypothetical protein